MYGNENNYLYTLISVLLLLRFLLLLLLVPPPPCQREFVLTEHATVVQDKEQLKKK